MKVICDVETNSLYNYNKLWLVVCKDIDTGEVHVFKNVHETPEPFRQFSQNVTHWVGHNFLGFDRPVLHSFCRGLFIPVGSVTDTLVVSRLVDYARDGGHSLEAWGQRFKRPKLEFPSAWFEEFDQHWEAGITYCIHDVEITYNLYNHFLRYLTSSLWKKSLEVEHKVSSLCNEMSDNGFGYNLQSALKLKEELLKEIQDIDILLSQAFKPKARLIREITPRSTKHGTIHRSDFRWLDTPDLSAYSVNAPFSLIDWEPFNASSPSQIVERLNEAGWKPTDKTKGHLQAIKDKDKEKIAKYKVKGWKVNETNLRTLPPSAPEGARKLAERIVLASRVGDLEEWERAYRPNTGRIHGRFNHIGSWTHRMSHQEPNMANIPRIFAPPKGREATPVEVLNIRFNARMRELWQASPGKLLVGTDAEGIQLRILAHYMNDERFTKGVTSGKKEDGSDPHSLNQRALGDVCRSRDDAKTFIYAWLLGAGVGKVAEILGCSNEEARICVQNFIEFYPGLRLLKEEIILRDAANGYFRGLDGRYVKCDDTHYMLAGYLQNGETLVMKHASILWTERLKKEQIPYKLVDFVHDEWQTEVDGGRELASYVGQVQAESIKEVGESLGCLCPLAGQFVIGNNWKETH
jgi:DNA polymerase-1